MDIRYGKPDYFDVVPDGERYLVVVPAAEQDGRTRVVVVGDWRAAVGR